jgi:spherulation-specific family 4 protein
VNPSNGPGGAVSSAYASGIARLTAAGIRVIGYVATGYTAVSSSTVKADIDRWKAFYPGQVTGIFFDEQSNKAGDVAYYRDLSQYSKAQGLSFTVGNPGTDTAEAFVGALDMMLIYESGGLPSASQLGGWHANHPASNFGIIPYATQLDATFVRNARKNVGYIYLQNDNLPNPWDSVPSYFSDLLAALE